MNEIVADPERRARALEIVEAFGAAEKEFLDDTLAIRERFGELNAAYGTRREEFDVELERLDGERVRFADTVLESWLDLATILEPDERKALVQLQLEEEERWRAMID